MPAYRRVEATRRALTALREAGSPPVILVDDEGTAGGEELVREFPFVEAVRTGSAVWWTGAITLAARRAVGRGDPAVVFYNQDVVCAPDLFDRLGAAADAHPGALVGCAVAYAHDPGCLWAAGGSIEWWGRGLRGLYHRAPAGDLPAEPFAVDWLYGMGTFVPRAVFARIGFPDADRFPQAWGDVDFCLRAKAAGIPILVAPRARLLHEVGAYDPHAAGPPSARLYASWLRDDKHNISLSAHAALWRRHGPRLLWPLSLLLRVGVLLLNYARIRVLFPDEARDE